jgi:hypothetical protein
MRILFESSWQLGIDIIVRERRTEAQMASVRVSGSGGWTRTSDLRVISGFLEHRPLDDHHRASSSRSWHDGMNAS